MTSPKMMEYQYKELIGQLSLLQGHAEDPRCPCTFSAGELNEFCIPKHLLTIAALASESASMEDNKDHKKLLFGIQEEAAQLHEDTKKTIICKKGPFTPGIEDWARKARKSLEPIYYACGVKTEAKREKAKVADPGHTLTADNVISHVKFEPNREKVVAAYIGPKRQVLGVNTVATGTAHSAPLPVDKVVREANAHQAKGIVLMHNHPSGTTEISQDDRDATRILREAASPLWVEHHIQGDTVAKVAEGSPATDITIRGRCKGKPSTCAIAVKGSEVVTKNAPSPASLKRTIEEVEADMKARRGVPPNPNTFAIGPSLTKYQFRFEVLEADQLVVSHNFKTFADTPGYPPDLQPRLRTRAAQVLQVQTIAATLDPDSLLVDFKSIEKGAPIIGKSDNVVECGNGRVMALQLSAENHPDKFGAYKAALVKLAPAYGIPAATVEKMKAPILVKRRLTDTDRAAFAQECNASSTIAPSAIETARTDAKLITLENIASLDIAEGQGIEQALRSPKNKAFTTSFLSKLPKNDQARLVDKDGQLNQEGVRRMTLALFLAAFHGDGGLRLAERSFEETEENVKNVLNGILRALGMLARAEQMAASGQRAPGLSISEDLAKVVAVYGQIKNTPGMTVAKYLAQSQMLERQLNPFQERLLSEIDKRARSAKAIGWMLNLYAQNVEQAPPPQQGGMMGMEITVTKDDLFSKALRALAEEEAAEAADKAAREARKLNRPMMEANVSEPSMATLANRIARAKTEEQKNKLFLSVYGSDRQSLLEHIILSMPEGTYLLKREGQAAPSLERAIIDKYGTLAGTSNLEKTVRGLSVTHPGRVSVNFTLGMDGIIIRQGKTMLEVSEPRSLLTRQKGETKDSHGCQLHYIVYTVRAATGDILERTYADAYGFGVQAKTLEELKTKMGNYKSEVSDPMLQKYIDSCNMNEAQMQAVWNFRPLRDFIMWVIGYGKVQVCQAGMIDDVYQVTIRGVKPDNMEQVTTHSRKVPGMKEVAVFGSKDRVFTVTMPVQTIDPSELLGGKQYVTAGHIHQAGEQPKLFERSKLTTRCRVVKQHDDGDQTLRCKEGTFVKTTDGKLFKEAKVNEQPDWNHLHDQGWELRQLIKVGNDVLVVEQPYEPALPSISPILNDVTDILSEIYRPPIGMNEYCVVKPFTHPTQIMGKRGDILTGKQRFDLSIHFRFSVRGKPGKQIEPHALTERVREPNVRDPLLAAVVSKACGLGLCVAEPKGKKSPKINMFGVENDTDKYIVAVDGFFGQFDTKEQAEKVYNAVGGYDGDDGLAGTGFSSSQMMAPHYKPKYIGGWVPPGGIDLISLHQPIDIADYIKKHPKRILAKFTPDARTAAQRLADKKFAKNWFGEGFFGDMK